MYVHVNFCKKNTHVNIVLYFSVTFKRCKFVLFGPADKFHIFVQTGTEWSTEMFSILNYNH